MRPVKRLVQILNRITTVFWVAFKETPAGFFAPLLAFWHAVKTNATPHPRYDEDHRSHGV
jgi:hypothetical protein